MKKKKPISVKWEDALTVCNTSLEEVFKLSPAIVETYGMIVHQDKKYTIVMTHNSGGESNDYIKIPTPLIR